MLLLYVDIVEERVDSKNFSQSIAAILKVRASQDCGIQCPAPPGKQQNFTVTLQVQKYYPPVRKLHYLSLTRFNEKT